MKKHVYALIPLLLVFIVFTGCASPNFFIEKNNTGTTCANVTMGNGIFAYRDEFIYCTDGQTIYEYDLQNRKTVLLVPKNTLGIKSMLVTPDYIGFAINGLKAITRDGRYSKTIFDRGANCIQLFTDGEVAYYIDYIGENLYQRDMQTGEETVLCDSILSYYVGDTYIYTVTKKDGQCRLSRSERETIKFEEMELSFEPITVYSCDRGVFMAQKGDYQIIRYENGIETKLPIYSTFYQTIDNCVIYSDSTEYMNGCFPVKSYNLDTGDETLLCENVFDFCILENRYISCECVTDLGTVFQYYDWQTGATVQMYPAA